MQVYVAGSAQGAGEHHSLSWGRASWMLTLPHTSQTLCFIPTMTSHTLAAFRTEDSISKQGEEGDCTFCAIASSHPHSDTLLDPAQAESSTSSSLFTSPAAYVTYSDPSSLAILDILPIRRGHTLVIPRRHVQQLSDLPLNQAGDLARALVRVTQAVGRALKDDRLQVITNQIYAQVVPHLHFHIVPAPPLPGSSSSSNAATSSAESSPRTLFRGSSPASISLLKAFGHGRDELDDDDALLLTRLMREALREVLAREEAGRNSKL